MHYYVRTIKHVPRFYRAMGTRVEIRENEKCCGNTSIQASVFIVFLEFSKSFTSVTITR